MKKLLLLLFVSFEITCINAQTVGGWKKNNFTDDFDDPIPGKYFIEHTIYEDTYLRSKHLTFAFSIYEGQLMCLVDPGNDYDYGTLKLKRNSDGTIYTLNTKSEGNKLGVYTGSEVQKLITAFKGGYSLSYTYYHWIDKTYLSSTYRIPSDTQIASALKQLLNYNGATSSSLSQTRTGTSSSRSTTSHTTVKPSPVKSGTTYSKQPVLLSSKRYRVHFSQNYTYEDFKTKAPTEYYNSENVFEVDMVNKVFVYKYKSNGQWKSTKYKVLDYSHKDDGLVESARYNTYLPNDGNSIFTIEYHKREGYYSMDFKYSRSYEATYYPKATKIETY